MLKIFLIILTTLALGCSQDENPSYEPIENILKSGGPTINYDPNSSFTNIAEVQKSLSEKESDIFIKSLSWFGTESSFNLGRVHNKNAKEVVDIVNCLNTSEIDAQEKCFN